MPGYDLKVHGDYARLESLLCSSCNLILKDAIQTGEGLRFCKSCWENIQKSPDLVSKLGVEVDLSEQIHPDIAVRREVDRLPIKCYNFENGCPWTGTLKEHEHDHKGKCAHKTELCTLGCGAKIPVAHLQEHIRSECPFRQMYCPHCRTQMLSRDYENHKSNCSEAPYSCEQCGINMSRSEVDQHSLLECVVTAKCCGCNEQIHKSSSSKQPNCLTHLKDAVDIFQHFQQLGFEGKSVRAQYDRDLNHIRAVMKRGVDSIEGDLSDLKTSLSSEIQQIEEQGNVKYQEMEHRLRELEGKMDKQNQIISQRSQPLVSGSYYPSNQSYEDVPSNDRIAQFDTKIAEQERTSGMLKVHISELELQLQASLASTYNGSFLWRIPDVRRRKRDAIDGKITSIYSPPFYTGRNGYKMCIRAYLNGDGIGYNTHVSIFFVLMKGEYDPLLKWPFDYKVSLILVDQDHKRHIVQTFKPSPSSSSFQRPKTDMNIASGCPKFAELKILENDSYVKDEVMYIKAIVDTTRIFHP